MEHTALHTSGDMIRGVAMAIVLVAIAGTLLVLALKKSEDPAVLVVKWICTGLVVGFMIWKIFPMVAAGGLSAIAGIFFTVACGWILAIIWRQSIAEYIAKPFQSLYDGGDTPAEPVPAYSVALARRKRGNYHEALAEVRKQLERFPNDFAGQMLLAEIQAENLDDLQGAEVTLHRLCNQEGHSASQIAMVWNTLADWHLKYQLDVDTAKLDLQRIIQRFPNTELSALAEQRIGHLANPEYLLARHDLKPVPLPAGIADLGLQLAGRQPMAAGATPEEEVEQCVRHLEQYPMDTDARERLAVLYADHYQRMDLATDQLEQMIQHPNQPSKRVVHWLNLLADLQVRHGGNYETVRNTVQRILEMYPDSPAAQTALNRLDRLKLEIKGQARTPTVALGSYEQDIGLKGRLPHQL